MRLPDCWKASKNKSARPWIRVLRDASEGHFTSSRPTHPMFAPMKKVESSYFAVACRLVNLSLTFSPRQVNSGKNQSHKKKWALLPMKRTENKSAKVSRKVQLRIKSLQRSQPRSPFALKISWASQWISKAGGAIAFIKIKTKRRVHSILHCRQGKILIIRKKKWQATLMLWRIT